LGQKVVKSRHNLQRQVS